MRYVVWPLLVASSFLLLACGDESRDNDSKLKDEGMVGTTCYSKPIVLNPQGRNVCIIPASNWPGLSQGEFWYSAFVAGVARESAVNACKEANALDYGVKYGKSCYKACEEKAVTSCIPLTPNPDV